MILAFGKINTHIYTGLDTPLKVGAQNFSAQNHTLEISGISTIHAISAARAGAKVSLIGTVGNDVFGKHCLETLRKEGINTSGIGKCEADTGIEISLNEEQNKRTIVISEGANRYTQPMQMPEIYLSERSLLLLSDDSDEQTVISLLNQAKDRGARSILCLGENYKLTPDALMLADMIIANDKSVKKPKNDHIVITKKFGIDGAAVHNNNGNQHGYQPPEKIEEKDINGCYEVFCGFFAACIQAGISMNRTIELASKASGAASQKPGFYKSIPYLGYVADIKDKDAKSQNY